MKVVDFKPLLEMSNINKSFPGVIALKNVNFNLCAGEIHGLVGENGAGKSTLMNVLMGMHRADSGSVLLHGVETEILSPDFAIRNSIGMVPQELNIVPEISIAENIFLGKHNKKMGFFLDWKQTRKKAEEIMRQLGSSIDVSKKASSCSIAQLQLVQMGRILAFGADIIILDEPTASLTYQETKELFKVIQRQKDCGKGIIFISHHMEEISELCDRVTVMRDGEVVGLMPIDETDIKQIISLMAGKEVVFAKFSREYKSEDIILEVKGLTRASDYRDVSFKVRRGEILGVGGLVGAGRTEVMLTLFGALKSESGSIILNGKETTINSPEDAINLGIGYLPEERREQGIFPILSVRENLTMPILERLIRHGAISHKLQNEITYKYIEHLGIKTPNSEKEIRDLSGGNQQKVIFARWIERDMDILILDEPTRGIDVRAKDEIHKLIETLAGQGKTIILVSSEIEELINISDRILVMNEGKVKGILDARTSTQSDILNMALNN